MKIATNNNFSVLPFYKNLNEQHHRRSYSYGSIYPLYTSTKTFPPFQIITQGRYTEIPDNGIVLINAANDVAETILRVDRELLTVWNFNETGASGEDYTVYVYSPKEDTDLLLPIGQYYIQVDTSAGTWFSDVFTVVGADMSAYMRIQWRDVRDFVMDAGRIVYNITPQRELFKMEDVPTLPLPIQITLPALIKLKNVKFRVVYDGSKEWLTGVILLRREDTGAEEGFTLNKTDTPNVYETDDVLYRAYYSEKINVNITLRSDDPGPDVPSLNEFTVMYANEPMPEYFVNELYVCSQLGRPEYEFEEEGETRDGYFFPQKQLSEKKYRFTMLAPEYLLDAMRFIRMADYVKITDTFGHVYDVDTFLMTPKWQPQGAVASVECEFETNTVAKKLPNILIG